MASTKISGPIVDYATNKNGYPYHPWAVRTNGVSTETAVNWYCKDATGRPPVRAYTGNAKSQAAPGPSLGPIREYTAILDRGPALSRYDEENLKQLGRKTSSCNDQFYVAFGDGTQKVFNKFQLEVQEKLSQLPLGATVQIKAHDNHWDLSHIGSGFPDTLTFPAGAPISIEVVNKAGPFEPAKILASVVADFQPWLKLGEKIEEASPEFDRWLTRWKPLMIDLHARGLNPAEIKEELILAIREDKLQSR
jgi:hypothetical protein